MDKKKDIHQWFENTLSYDRNAHNPKIGRKRGKQYPSDVIQTRLPYLALRHLKIEAARRMIPQSNLFNAILLNFMREKPYEDPEFKFKKPKKRTAPDEQDENRWVLVNMMTRYEIAKDARKIAKNLRVSIASFAMTAIWWWLEQEENQKERSSQ